MEHLNRKKITNHIRHDALLIDQLWDDIYRDFLKLHYKFLTQTEYEISKPFENIHLQLENDYITVRQSKSDNQVNFVCTIHSQESKQTSHSSFLITLPLVYDEFDPSTHAILCTEKLHSVSYQILDGAAHDPENPNSELLIYPENSITKLKSDEQTSENSQLFELYAKGSKDFGIYLRKVIYVCVAQLEANMYAKLHKRKNIFKTNERLAEIKAAVTQREQDLRVNFPERYPPLNHGISVSDSDSAIL